MSETLQFPPKKKKPDKQVQAVLASIALEPAAHGAQVSLPLRALNVPEAHAVHVSPSGPDQPALQMQLVIAMLPIGELEAAGQSSQLPDPAALLYLPARHALHVPPSAPHQPALQVQLLKAVLCTGELEFA